MTPVVNLLLVSLLLYVLYYFLKPKQKYKLPPGPSALTRLFTPLFTSHETYMKWSKKYGPLIQSKVGLTDLLILNNDPKLIREAFGDPAMSGRTTNQLANVFAGGKFGISNADGQDWMEQRRFVLRNLRDFGFGKQSMDSLISEEVIEFMKWIKENESQPVSVNRKFTLAVVNSLWTIVAGQRNDQNDPTVNKIIDGTDKVVKEISSPASSILFIFPRLPEILPKFLHLPQWEKAVQSVVPFTKILTDTVDIHLKNPADENPRDLIDAYLAEIKGATDPTSSFYKQKGYESLVAVIGDLYLAGSGTTSATLTWAVLYLLRFPEVQAKLQQELDDVVGKKNMCCLGDKPKLPYVEAVMNETFRHSSFTPLGVPHEAMEDTKLGDYDVKKGTTVMANLYSVHYNPDIWGDPETFRPERFLSEDGSSIAKSENLIAFSIGRRVCIGESLARDTFFLFLTNIVQRFQILPDPADPNPTLHPVPGFFRDSKKFTVVFKDRFN